METNCWDIKIYRNKLEMSQFSGKIRIFLHSLHSLSTLILYSSASDTLSSLSLTFLEKLNVQKHSRGRQMSKGGNFVSEAVLYFKVIYPNYYKYSNFCFWVDWAVSPVEKNSAILLKYPTFECFIIFSREKQK